MYILSELSEKNDFAETKGSSLSSHLRKVEEAKIKCARKLFADIGNDSIGYDVVASFEQLLEKLE